MPKKRREVIRKEKFVFSSLSLQLKNNSSISLFLPHFETINYTALQTPITAKLFSFAPLFTQKYNKTLHDHFAPICTSLN